ncbi:putative G-protein coupled receptor CG31760 [Dermacentor variabilis]|uniref:putative G-protein coupled receptor CG31760 n=1 Tax=Dermacentor variabilis TaxID=34621 RepID=UPI003F5C96FC
MSGRRQALLCVALLGFWALGSGCLHCKHRARILRYQRQRPAGDDERPAVRVSRRATSASTPEERLERVESVACDSTAGAFPADSAATAESFHVVDVELPEAHAELLRQKVDLAARLLVQVAGHNSERLLLLLLNETLASDERFSACRVLLAGANGTASHPWVAYMASLSRAEAGRLAERRNFQLANVPWLPSEDEDESAVAATAGRPRVDATTYRGRWSNAYYSCQLRRWLVSYTVLVFTGKAPPPASSSGSPSPSRKPVAMLSVDLDTSGMDIDQCDSGAPAIAPRNGGESAAAPVTAGALRITAFHGTHRCHNRTSQCLFARGHGWSRGSYVCQCRRGFYAATGDPFFNGSLVESAWREKVLFGRPTYDMLYVCKPCRPGCNECVDDSPCLSHYNWAFRISLLTISVICIVLTMVLAGYVYRYRKLKVIKVASPVFLCITLIGCAIMYCEMAAIFPVLDVYCCVATKWTRHMGFCITYSTLLLKTWRVSLTYRVKSAHKLKLTDKQLLQWLFPILLEMAIYLGTWTISSPPDGIYLKDWHGLKFKQCEYNWWDHTMAIGEFLFLLWGIRVCYNVRNAESFFNEAKHISWAIYNITIVNLIMMLIHLVILPSASPDVKYLFGFIRTQLSTTVTVILIFGPKFYRVIKGQGDMWDNRARARGVTASFSLNGVGLMHEETVDLYQENEELKEEIQKLAAQIEFMKIVHMEMNNRHLKPKHGGFFSSSSQGNSTQSPVVKAMCIKFDNTDSPGSRISPAAELVSERV